MKAQAGGAPLKDITVIDFSELLPGPFLTQNLAELGARVIKIERPPHGDNARLLGKGGFEAVNRGKQSLLADLKDETQRDQVRALIAEADVVVESYRPGVMARLGLDAETLRKSHPRLIYVSLSGYGQTGPWADLPGHDINYLAASGALAVSGPPEGEPAQHFGLPVADLCGAMYALSATLAALVQRSNTGQGQHLDVALADCMTHWMNPRLGAYRSGGIHTVAEQRHTTLVKAAYGAFRCGDGQYLSIAALEDHFWQRLVQVLDLAPFDAEDYRRHDARKAHAEAINQGIARAVANLDSRELFERLQAHDIPAAPVIAPSALATLPQFVSRDRFVAGEVLPLARFPVPMSGLHAVALNEAPSLGSLAH